MFNRSRRTNSGPNAQGNRQQESLQLRHLALRLEQLQQKIAPITNSETGVFHREETVSFYDEPPKGERPAEWTLTVERTYGDSFRIRWAFQTTDEESDVCGKGLALEYNHMTDQWSIGQWQRDGAPSVRTLRGHMIEVNRTSGALSVEGQTYHIVEQDGREEEPIPHDLRPDRSAEIAADDVQDLTNRIPYIA